MALIAMICLCLAAAPFLFLQKDLGRMVFEFLNTHTPPCVLVSLFFTLPILGVPISIFLVLLGIRFGSAYGLLLLTAGLPLHLLITFTLCNSFLRPRIKAYAEKRGYAVPSIPEDKQIWYSFMFMLLPGLPYALKNYLLSLSGVSFPIFLVFGWLTNIALGAPIVILGGAAGRWNLLLPGIFLVLLSLGYIRKNWAKKRLGDPPH